MNWNFNLPVKILFGRNRAEEAVELTKELGSGLLVCDPFLADGPARGMMRQSQGRIAEIFSAISPNPAVEEVDACCEAIRRIDAKYLIAMGGGSVMDIAKAASVIAFGEYPAREYHTGGKPLPQKHTPVFAIPTTAGTGSEVTSVSVLTDRQKGIKAPIGSPILYVNTAVIDPVLTLSVPPRVTASTGLDVLAHAIEGYWSVHHQPICDAAAMHASKLVFENLLRVYENPQDIDAREKMCEASLMAGIAFSHPKTTGSHACSYPLTNIYGMPHGEACAFTLGAFIRINADQRVMELARYCGFDSVDAMADAVEDMKKKTGMKRTLADAGIYADDVKKLAEDSMHPNMLNNPVPMDVEAVERLYRGLV